MGASGSVGFPGYSTTLNTEAPVFDLRAPIYYDFYVNFYQGEGFS